MYSELVTGHKHAHTQSVRERTMDTDGVKVMDTVTEKLNEDPDKVLSMWWPCGGHVALWCSYPIPSQCIATTMYLVCARTLVVVT